MTFSDKLVYIGGWKNGLQNGQGMLKHINGNMYNGQFKDGKLNGEGTLTCAKSPNSEIVVAFIPCMADSALGVVGNTYKGQFKDDSLDGDIIITNSKGEKRKNTIRMDLRQICNS